MQKILFTLLAFAMTALSAHAQLKVSSDGNVSVGTTASSASTFSVNSSGESNYAAYIKGNMKVTGGHVNANVFQPIPHEGWDTTAITNGVISNLLELQPKMHRRALPSFRDLPGPNEYHPLSVHFSIDNMPSFFPLLAKTDSNGNTQINYSELVPLLVLGQQQLVTLIATLHNLSPSTLEVLLSCEDEAEMQDILANARDSQSGSQEDSRQARPTRQARRFADAVLYQNTPNPFTAQTEIRFRLPEDAKDAYICIFDMTGKTLKQIPVSGSQQSVTIQGYEFSAGMYLYSLIVNGQEIDTKRMILSK